MASPLRTTSAERMRALRARRRRGKPLLEVDLHEDDLREIALRGSSHKGLGSPIACSAVAVAGHPTDVRGVH
jgi:hypothetical protein